MRRLLTTAAVAAVVAITAPADASFVAEPGYYSGFSGGEPVHFRYEHGKITDFSFNNYIRIPEVAVTNAAFDGSFGHRHLKGQWTSATHVTGTYSYLREVRGGYIRQTISWTAVRKHH